MNLFYIKKTLLIFCLLLLFTPGRAQSDEYLQTMNWLKKNNVIINNPTPLKGYQMYRDCDSNPVYKKVSGDTISFFTTTSWEAKTFEQVVQIQKRPYFNVTAFPLKVQKNGSFLVAKMTPVTFLFKKDTILLLDFSASEEAARMKTLEQMEGMVFKNIQNAHGDAMHFATDLANQSIDSSDLQSFGKISNAWAADYPPDHVPLFYKGMFSRNRSVSFTPKVYIPNGKMDAAVAKIELMKEWEKEGEKYYFIDYQKNKNLSFFRLLNQYIITANGNFPVFENCSVNYKIVKRSVDSLNVIRTNEAADSLYQKYRNAAENPVNKFGKAVASNETARVVLYGRVGNIDKLGRDIIPIRYNELSSFHDGLAYVGRDYKGGYINKKGEEVIPLKYSRVSNFSDGLASVKINDQWQVINTQGQELFSLPYEEVEGFNEGFAKVYLNKKTGLINTKGKEVIPVKYDQIYDRFSEGFIRVGLNDKIGFIDSTGKALTPLIYDAADGFSDGLAGVRKDHKVGFIDNKFNEVIAFKYDLAFPFKQGVSIVRFNGLYGLIDKAGKEIIPVKYDGISSVDTGLFAVMSGGLVSIMDKDGKTVLPFTYTMISKFKNGYALVEKGNQKQGIINKQGKEIIPLRYNNLDPVFQDDLIAVHLNNRSGYVDKNGNEIIPVKYESTIWFSEGLAAVQLDKKWGFINRKNEVVIPIKYDLVNSFSNGLAAVSLNHKWGFVDARGNLVIPCIFEQAEDFQAVQNK